MGVTFFLFYAAAIILYLKTPGERHAARGQSHRRAGVGGRRAYASGDFILGFIWWFCGNCLYLHVNYLIRLVEI